MAAIACPDDQTLATLALGGDGDGALDAHLAACAACLSAWRELRRALHALGRAAGDAAPHLRERVVRSAAALDVFAGFEPAAATLLDIDRRAARGALLSFHDAGFRVALPGVSFRRAPVGPARARSFAVLARLDPGAVLPRHKHLGDESTLVLQGRLADGPHAHGPGGVLRAEAGSQHEVRALGDEACCCVVVADGGVVWA